MSGNTIAGWSMTGPGMNIALFGLLALIIIALLAGSILLLATIIIRKTNPSKQETAALPVSRAAVPMAAPMSEREKFVAAVSATVAIAMKTEPGAIRIHSIKKLS